MASRATTTGSLAPDERFAVPAVEVLDDAEAARSRVRDLVPGGSAVFTSSSQTLRLSGIEDDVSASGRYQAVKPRVRAMDRATHDGRDPGAHGDARRSDRQRRRGHRDGLARGGVGHREPDPRLRSAARTGGSGSPAPRKIVPDLATALHRLEAYALPLEDARARAVYGRPSAANEVLIVSDEPYPGRSTVLLLRQAIGSDAEPRDPGRRT